MITLEIVDWVYSSCSKLEESMCPCDANEICGEYSNNGILRLLKKRLKLEVLWEEEAPDEYGPIVKNHEKTEKN